MKTSAAVKAELDHLSKEFFRAVSFEAGGMPPFDLIRELFVPMGLLIKNSGATPEISTLDEFIAPRRAAVQAGELTQFLEIELWETTRIASAPMRSPASPRARASRPGG